eukprot:COSAG02_NODE_6308_length_3665_cov_3.449243_2_plen_88_part_00
MLLHGHRVAATSFFPHTNTTLYLCARLSITCVHRVCALVVVWLQTTLTPNLTDEEATEHFEGLITQALSERRDRVFRDLAHIWAHGK